MLSPRKPPWLKKPSAPSPLVHRLKKRLRENGLNTVCESARCPNMGECFQRPTATFMILGNVCTRRCGFCGVSKGYPMPVDPEEPAHVAEMAKELGLTHIVITSVTRDDLRDGGASQFQKTIALIRKKTTATIEALTPDFFPDTPLKPDVYNHNLETVPRLYPIVRPQADFASSLNLLRRIKDRSPNIITKSGIMLGLGETTKEVLDVMERLRYARCDALTIGQYLRPSKDNLPVREYARPETFKQLEQAGKSMGFRYIAAGPFVRSSFNAEKLFHQAPDMVNYIL